MKNKLFIAFVLVITLVLTGVYVNFRMKLSRRNLVATLMAENSMINVLIAGSNSFNDNRNRFFMIASINPENRKIGLTFVPPAYRVDIHEDGVGKEISSLDITDFKELSKALEADMGLKIPFYAILYAPDAERIVDLVEGLKLYVFEKKKLLSGIDFGEEYFDGNKAVQYINITENNSIYYKYDRVMDFIFSFYISRDQYKKYNNLPFIDRLTETIKTNLTAREVQTLGSIFFDDSKIYWTLLPGKINSQGMYVSDEIAKRVFADQFLKKLVIEEKGEKNVKVKILNATNLPGIARKFRSQLMKDGISVVEFGTYERGVMQNSVIIDQKGDLEGAELVSQILGVTEVHHIIDSAQLQDVLVIIGTDLGETVHEK